ncbi:GMC family oxidoreductase [Ancylobacter defluvii]|uniref:Choline dehydrogenase n=1 Tax=Ancylobacter defluvii TaxID=1282440 RepID=A0A9W6JW38_9HYPH|nr:GMC family oxidoreductase N-terminal domain-containing protein [Ancylobacter defluvii]MBS7587931.1 GMC family oxidoreductase N-terminal domain-containing protein [Ancylobacter defluvii]GLK83613.1 choline dehydrogenase [Ancylobacter defluvii]
MVDDTSGEEQYDYIIVGAGSAGCVLANRLSADPGIRVLLLEAGGRDDWIWFHIPVGYLFAIGNPRADWMFRTEAEPGLNGRALAYPRGKVIGGCSAINAMIYMRGQAGDYDGWRQLGLSGWGWDDVLPLFKGHEDHYRGGDAFHGSGGEWRVEYPRLTWPLLDRVREAAAQDGITPIDDYNTGDNEGSAYFQVNQKRGRRWSAARGFLKPVLDRPNLILRTGCLTERVILDGYRAVGIAYRQHGVARTARVRGEVILSAGAIGSPQILMLSGIGPGAELARHGIDVALDRPGIGANLQDHLQLRLIYKVHGANTLNERYHSLWGKASMALDYALFRRGPLTMAPSQLGLFTRSRPEKERADLEFHVQPLSLGKFGEPLHRFPAFTMSVCNLRPSSRGDVRLASADPAAAPVIRPNYLATEEDRQVAIDSLRVARRIVTRPALAPLRPEEFLPGPLVGDDDDSLLRAAGEIGTTIFHPVGTAKMGLPSDPLAVVDERLRVFGIEGLRVADASVMPSIVSGNTASPTMMIAEKAAAMIHADRR